MKIPKFMLRGFSRPSDALIASLGALERETMREVWRRKEVSVRQVSDAFDERVAYTTVMTTLDRLYKKGLLERRKDGRAFLYAARFSPEELEQGLAQDVIGSLLDTTDSQIEPVLACIVDAVSERDLLLLDELERLVQEKRRAILGEEE
jgi:predicted transcriptional regulator